MNVWERNQNETNTKELKNEKFSKDDNILTLHLTSHMILLPSGYYMTDSKFSFFFLFQIIDNRNSYIILVHICIKIAI